ncbi:TRAP transporter small permease [Nitratireductor basaltis]|uniref:TRAP transporter small permease protein n=1 Tax=Nitratireductor basaltis TaxID=472175 RepID=A0A084U633_9HYPH|nr:TRAP transporter small permease [Nitratireductor basaltis]KFB08419.1 hypothetical protein EL18_02670 [Nitratireductor basaltis]
MSVWPAIWPRQGGGNAPLLVWLERLARLSAAMGGAVIFGVALTVTISVMMRNIGIGGIRGDFEMVSMSCVFAAGLFLPLCQVTKNHVMVDLFTTWLPTRATAALDGLWLGLFAVGWALLCYFTVHGMLDMMDYGDRSMLLRLPLWWAYVPSIIGSGISCVIALCQLLILHDVALPGAEV